MTNNIFLLIYLINLSKCLTVKELGKAEKQDAALKVLELHPRATLEEVKEGIALLRSQGYC